MQVRGRAKRVLWVEQFWNVHQRKLDREIFADCPSTKIGSLENFQLYGSVVLLPVVKTIIAIPVQLIPWMSYDCSTVHLRWLLTES